MKARKLQQKTIGQIKKKQMMDINSMIKIIPLNVNDLDRNPTKV